MTREEFITEMRKRAWVMDDIREILNEHDERERAFGQTLPYEVFLIDNIASSLRTYQIREDGCWEDVMQEDDGAMKKNEAVILLPDEVPPPYGEAGAKEYREHLERSERAHKCLEEIRRRFSEAAQ